MYGEEGKGQVEGTPPRQAGKEGKGHNNRMQLPPQHVEVMAVVRGQGCGRKEGKARRAWERAATEREQRLLEEEDLALW